MHNEGDDFFVKSNGNPPPCPECRGQLEYRDRKRRIMRLEGAEKQWILIRRFRCTGCSDTIMNFPIVWYPSSITRQRLLPVFLMALLPRRISIVRIIPAWTRCSCGFFQLNQERIEGYLRTIAYELSDGKLSVLHSDLSLLKWFRLHARNWLERIIHSIYNSGGFLVSFRF